MVASYPSTIPSFTTKYDQTDVNWAADINRLQDEVAALAGELGTTPKRGFASVAERLGHLQDTKSDVGHAHDERYVQRSLATSKGVLVAASSAGNFASVAAGAAGETLVADPAQPAGVRWRVLSHGDLPGLANDDHPQYLTTDRHASTSHLGILSSISITALLDVTGNPTIGQVLKWDGNAYAPAADTDTTDHGALSGLADDDHPQYLTAARHGDRAAHDALAITHASLTGLAADDHPQYAKKSVAEVISGAWDFSARPTVNGYNLMSSANGGRYVWVQAATPSGGVANGDVWFRP